MPTWCSVAGDQLADDSAVDVRQSKIPALKPIGEPLGLQMERQTEAVVFGQHRLGIKRVHLRRTAIG